MEVIMTAVIEPMKKICLSLLAGSEESSFTFTPDPVAFEFIYGIGREGLTPFEQLLNGRKTGDKVELVVTASEAPVFLGSLLLPLTFAAGISIFPAQTYIRLEILSIADAENREIIKALAKSVGHGGGCGGSCDCGC